MNIKKIKAFTLVELIVVITILAILGTIAFISLQGYSRDARDATRTSDIKSLKTGLELFILNTGFYPNPSDGIDVTYSGASVRVEGTIGDSVIINVDKLNNKPTDPLAGNEYTYSRLNTKKEYEIGAVLEGDIAYNPIISQTYADTIYSYISGTYNGVVAKVNTGGTDYVLAVPTIISSDLGDTDLVQIMTKKALAFDSFNNIPSSYAGYTTTGGFDYLPSSIVVFEGNVNNLSNSGTLLKNFADNLQSAYSGSNIANTGIYAEILAMDTSVESEVTNLAGNIVNISLGGQIITSTDSNSCVSGTQIFNYTGVDQNITIPTDCNVTIKMWGAGGGGGNNSSGGGGGYSILQDYDLSGNYDLTVIVGKLGVKNGNTYAGGGGGGRSEVLKLGTRLIVAGGGAGGGGNGNTAGGNGGAGGGLVGLQGSQVVDAGGGFGGTQLEVGSGGIDYAFYSTPTSGSGSNGGVGCTICVSTYGGGTTSGGGLITNGGRGNGGGGFFGGGAGAGGQNSSGGGGGGGGSSYIISGGIGNTIAGSGNTPGNQSDIDRAGAGQGGTAGVDGTDGIVIVSWQ